MDRSAPIVFEQLFDIDELQKLQDQFAIAFGVASVITTPDGDFLTKPSNFSYLCERIIRCTEKGLINCKHSDSIIGRQNPEGPIVQQCLSGGLWDAGASITVGGRHVANWLVGQVRNLHYDENKIIKYAREIGADLTEFIRAYFEIPSMSIEQFQRIADLLFTMAGQLSEKAYQNVQKARLIQEKTLVNNALLESEERNNAFINANTDMLFVKDENFRYMMANDAMADFFNNTKEELLAKTDQELAQYSLIYPCISSDQKALESSSIIIVEERFGDRIFEVTKFPLNLKDNKKGIGGIMRDITARKVAVEALNAERTLLRTMIDNLPVSIYVKNVECRKIVSNITDVEKLGFSSESEVLGKTDLELFKDQDGFQSYNDDLMVIKCGKAIINKEENFPNQFGGRRWTLTSKIPLFDQQGIIVGLVGIGRDITEQRLANETIQKLSKGIEQSPSTIVVTDAMGNIEYANPRFFEITGYTPEETIGQNPRILKSGEMSPESYKNMWKTISSGEVWRGEFHNRKKNGELFWESATITCIKNERGEITNYIAIKEDVSDRKQMEADLIVAKERAEESDRLKSAFLANMSHEIRTPLNSIIGFSELLAYSDFDDKQKKNFVEQIIRNGNNLLNIINDIVDISKIEAGEITIRLTSIPVFEFIQDIRLMFSHRIELRGLQFRIDLPERTRNCLIYADYERLKQVFSNLIGNALKFTADGFIEIGCRQLNKNLEFRVSDTGIGIAPEHHVQIFDRFRQVETSYKRKYGGNGLGLAITKNLVELMGGRIWLESDAGKGSTFFFTIPYKRINAEINQ
jgi:PAS domain S-box-containing protein